jgi:NSS family neurotransmitter:Na+ symporter
MMICIYVIVNGVKGGIEKWSRIMMPLIIILLAIIAIRGVTLDGGMAGISFLFKPRFEDLTASAIVLALGHAFFTLSLGMGTMITYGSYLKKNENLLNSALWVIGLDTFIALLAGVAIFTTVFALGANPAEGPGLIFVVLPSVFSQMDGGAIWGSLFFFLLFMAALTSGISILEVVTAYFIDQKNWSREKATIVFGIVISGVGIFCSLSNGGFTDFSDIFGISFMDFMDYLSSKYMLPIGGMLMAIFIIKRWTVNEFIKEINTGMDSTIISSQLVTVLLSIGALVVGFFILNEIFDKLLGFPIIG